jgi:hypothetical protein
MRRRAALLVLGFAGAATATACTDIPAVAYETEHFEVAPDFEHPICAGTLAYFEEHLSFVESSLARSVPFGEHIRFYWITEDLDSWCSERALGCYYPGTRVIVGSGESVSHEIVHAVLNAESQTNYFLEEGMGELYSGVATYHLDIHDTRPDPGELLWLTPSDYRFGDLDYDVAGHFMAYVEATYGSGVTRAMADVVVTAAGPPELENAFARFTGVSFETLEKNYAKKAPNYYHGLRELDVAEILDRRWIDVSLRCDEDETFGPRPDTQPGMYRTLRLVLQDPRVVDVELIAPPRVTATFVDVRRELGAGVVVDYHYPKLSGRREHEVVRGGESRALNLRKGTHLVVIAQDGYTSSDAFLHAVPRDFPRADDPPQP